MSSPKIYNYDDHIFVSYGFFLKNEFAWTNDYFFALQRLHLANLYNRMIEHCEVIKIIQYFLKTQHLTIETNDFCKK